MAGRMIIPDEALRYVLFQRTAYLRVPNMLLFRIVNRLLPFAIYNRIVELESKIYSQRIKSSYESDIANEYLSIKAFLPKKCSSILDIGCGVAGIDVFLANHYERDHPRLYLLDKTHVEKSVWYGLKNKGAFYNSLDIAKALLVENGVRGECVHVIEATDNNEINFDDKVDLVISLISWGFHYPVGTYLQKVRELLTDGGRLIIDVRKGTDGVDVISDAFGGVEVIADREKHLRILAVK